MVSGANNFGMNTSEVYHMIPPRMEYRDGNKKDSWLDFRLDWKMYAGTGVLKKKSNKEKTCTLLSMAGREAIKHMSMIDPEDKITDPDEVLKKLDEHFLPKKNIILERFNFAQSRQSEGETFDEFLSKITNLVKSCECPITEEDLLRDKIVSGIANNKLRQDLLCKQDLSLKLAIDYCRTSEAAKIQASQFKVCEEENVNMDAIRHRKRYGPDKSKSNWNDQMECKFCGWKHPYGKCPAYGKSCAICNKVNHYARCCPARNMSHLGEENAEDEIELDDYGDEKDC